MSGYLGHILEITQAPDFDTEYPDWDFYVVCAHPSTCIGWEGCPLPHEVNGISAADGPYDSGDDDPYNAGGILYQDFVDRYPWFEREEFEFHGELHTWRYDWGWTLPFDGCIVQVQDFSDSAYEIAVKYGPGRYVVEDDWWDESSVILIYVRPADPEILEDKI